MTELESTVTQKGQVTIPAAIRDRVRFEVEDGMVRLRRVTSKILAGYGSVTPNQQPEDFQSLRDEFERGMTEVYSWNGQFDRIEGITRVLPEDDPSDT